MREETSKIVFWTVILGLVFVMMMAVNRNLVAVEEEGTIIAKYERPDYSVWQVDVQTNHGIVPARVPYHLYVNAYPKAKIKIGYIMNKRSRAIVMVNSFMGHKL